MWKRSARVLSIAGACTARNAGQGGQIHIFHLTLNLAIQNLFFSCTYWLDSVTLSIFSKLNYSMILIHLSFTKPPRAEMHIYYQQLLWLIPEKTLKMWGIICREILLVHEKISVWNIQPGTVLVPFCSALHGASGML